MKCKDYLTTLEGVIGVRVLLTDMKSLKEGEIPFVVEALLSLLQRWDQPQVQHEALWSLSFVTGTKLISSCE